MGLFSFGAKKSSDSSFSNTASRSSSSTNPLSARELLSFNNTLSRSTGGRLNKFARNGTPNVAFNGLNPQQVQALGGLGANRRLAAGNVRREALQQIASDPSLNTFQQQRSRQLANRDFAGQLDAIAKESGAAVTGAVQSDNARRGALDMFNSQLTARDLELLSSIFFAGKGTRSSTFTSSGTKQGSQGRSSGFDVGIPG